MRRGVLLTALALSLPLGCSRGEGQAGLAAEGLDQDELTVIATLEPGAGPGQVTLRPPGPEVAAGGPLALAAGSDGQLALADTLAGRVVRLGPHGPLPPLPAPGVEDVAVEPGGRIFAWSRELSRVTVFDQDGQEVETHEVPRTLRWITGLCPWPGGGLGLHTAYQESVSLEAGELHRDLAEGVPGPGGERYRTVRRRGTAYIEVLDQAGSTAARRIEVEVRDVLGSLELVGATGDGEIVVDVQEVTGSDPVRVERRVRRYGPDGEERGQVLVPRGLYAPAHALELGPDGTVYALVPTLAGLELRAWPGAEGGAR